MRLLAVDDDPLILDLLPIVFRQANLPQITVASSGAAALEALDDPDARFDGLILDIEMPEMSGIELCQKVRQIPRYRNTPILMLTAVTDRTRIERAFAAGADDYITKPFDVKEIATRVRVAERMTERSVHAPILDPDVVLEDAPQGSHRFAADDPVRLAGTPQLILPFALGNYLSQLSRRRLDSCSIFAARLADIDTHYHATRPHEFARLLKTTVAAIAKVVDWPHLLMSYEGDGLFMCITQGADAPEWPEIEDRVNEELVAATGIMDNGHRPRLEISIGNPVMPNASRNQRVKKTFDRARDRLHSREKIRNKGTGRGDGLRLS